MEYSSASWDSDISACVQNETYKTAKDPDWDNKKVAVMEEILRAKLAQHVDVRESLKRSGSEEIVESSPVDYF